MAMTAAIRTPNGKILQGKSPRGRGRSVKAAKTKSAGSKRRNVKITGRAINAAKKPAGKSAGRSRGRQTAEAKLAELKRRLLEISDLNFAGAVLSWDQATYMPPGGAAARGRQTAMLSKLAHEKSIDPALGRLLDALVPHSEKLPYDSDDASVIRVARRDFDKAIRVPSEYVERAAAHNSASYMAWTKARPANDFAAMRPFLEKNIELSREVVRWPRGASWYLSFTSYAISPQQTTTTCGALLPRPSNSNSTSRWPSGWDTISNAAGSTRPFIRSAPSSAPAMCASPPGSTRPTSARRCSRLFTKPATPCTSRASPLRSSAHR